MIKKRMLCLAFSAMLVLTACGTRSNDTTTQEASAEVMTEITSQEVTIEASLTEQEDTAEVLAEESKPTLNMMMIKGFPSLGAVNLMEANEQQTSSNIYNIAISITPDEVTAKLLSGEVDIAAIPTNMAATLYNKSDGQIKILAINTLGVIKLISTDDSIQTLEDLKGKSMLGSGKGAIPEYTFDYILRQNGIDPEKDLTIEYKPGHEETSTLMSEDQITIATIPEPSATQVLTKNDKARIVLDITEEWDKLNTGATLSQGCIVVQSSLIEKNPTAITNFLQDYTLSTQLLQSNLDETAILCAKFDILPEQVAITAIPRSNQVMITGNEMRDGLKPFFQILFDANPDSIGGALPTDDFYYIP